ncbi:pyruvate dehydrogenase E1 component subunit alpha [Mycobacterium tuberculosis]|nr:pyruvate dehydrogenase E1 component subunit alpha [Mycobacterium tuberculosis]
MESALQTVMSADAPSIDELDQDVYAAPLKHPV